MSGSPMNVSDISISQPQISFADLELAKQGVELDPRLAGIMGVDSISGWNPAGLIHSRLCWTATVDDIGACKTLACPFNP